MLGGDWIYQAHLFDILTNENTGLPWELFGTKEFNDKFLEMIVYRYATEYIYNHEEFGLNREKILFIYQRINAKAGNMDCLGFCYGLVPKGAINVITDTRMDTFRSVRVSAFLCPVFVKQPKEEPGNLSPWGRGCLVSL